MELFYSENISGDQIFLNEEESLHCIKSLRHRAGDELMITNGEGKLFRTQLLNEDKKHCALRILNTEKEIPESMSKIHVAIAPTKNIDRFEWFLEKATEIGVTQITPIICSRSERDRIKHERLQKILIGAMKQSLRLWLPRLNPILRMNAFLTHDSRLTTRVSRLTTHDFICHCQSPNIPSLKSLYKPGEDVTIMIGPEGDFTAEEIGIAEASGFTGVTLGENRLRTETAGIVAVHSIQMLNG